MSGTIDRKKSQKNVLKEKVLQVYDKLFQGQDITQGRAEFWDDFFLLKANIKCLVTRFEKLSSDDLICVKPQLSRLFLQCLHTAQSDRHRIRVANAIQTLDALVFGISKCKAFQDSHEMCEFLLSSEQTNDFTEGYISLFCSTIQEDRSERLRALMFNSILTFVAVISPLEQNPFATDFLDARVFDIIYATLTSAQLRYYHGLTACRLLGLLLQYKSKNENCFETLICRLDDDLLSNGISSTISGALSEFNQRFRQQHETSGGFLSSMSSFFSGLVAGDVATNLSLRPCDSLLLCLFGLLKSSAHFPTSLSYSNGHCGGKRSFETMVIPDALLEQRLLKAFSTDSLAAYLPTNEFSPGRAVPVLPNPESKSGSLTNQSGTPNRELSELEVGQYNYPNYAHINSSFRSPNLTDVDSDLPNKIPVSLEPRNLLADLLEYCSIVMQDVKAVESLNSCQLCFIIIWYITQNPLACALLHDSQIGFKVRIHKVRSRKADQIACDPFSSRPVAVAILELIVEFGRGHLMKKLPHRLYSICLSIVRNLLTYQKKHKIRLGFDWKQLWAVILNLLQFVLKLDSTCVSLSETLGLIHKGLKVFNFFILHGDSFLQSADIYDNLYYELIRMRTFIENLYEYCLQHSTNSSGEVKTFATEVVLQLGNLRSIVNHFNAKVFAFTTTYNLTSLTEDQVLAVVRDNYDSLTLRFLEDLDVIDEYNESEDSSYFDHMSALQGFSVDRLSYVALFEKMKTESIMRQMRKDVLDTSLQAQDFLHELSTIP